MWLAILIFLSDQLSKYLAREANTALLNYGGIFGLFPGYWWTAFVTLVLIAMLVILRLRKDTSKLQSFGWYIVIGAGFGNLRDRLLWGGVWDWIYYPVINVVGNLADIWLAIGFVVLLVSELNKKPYNTKS